MIDFPNSPTVGEVVTALNGRSWSWNGSMWVAVTGGTGGASGRVAYAQVTTDQGGVASQTWVDVAGLSVIANLVAGRTYKITSTIQAVTSAVPGTVAAFAIANGAGTQLQSENLPFDSVTAGVFARAHPSLVITATASGPQTFKIMMGRSHGGGTITAKGDVDRPNYILVEDITYEAGSSVVGVAAEKYYYAERTTSAGPVTAATAVGGLELNITLAARTLVVFDTFSNAVKPGTATSMLRFSLRLNTTTVMCEDLVMHGVNGFAPHRFGCSRMLDAGTHYVALFISADSDSVTLDANPARPAWVSAHVLPAAIL